MTVPAPARRAEVRLTSPRRSTSPAVTSGVRGAIPAEAGEPGALQDGILESIHAMVAQVQDYVPGYRLLQEPQFDDPSEATRGATKVSIFLEVEGAGDFLPPYSGNLDIMTAAATRAGEGMARHLMGANA